jgi:uncharacterized lipoprotein YbaY
MLEVRVGAAPGARVARMWKNVRMRMNMRSVQRSCVDASRRGVRTLAVGACGIVLAGCATDSATTRGAAAPDPTRTLAISGALTYRARVALPADARAVIEVKEGAGDDGMVVAEQRIDLKGRQVPIPFALAVDRARLRHGATYRVRGAVFTGARVVWSSDPVVIDAKAPVLDLGFVWMQAAQPTSAFATTWRCGGQDVTLDYTESFAQLIVRTERFRMRSVPAAGAGMRFEAMSDPSTSLAYDGDKARLTIRGNAYPDCTEVRAAAPLR